VTDDIPPEPAKPAHAAKQLVKSADKLATSAEQQTDSADRRTVLAADRTVLAAERTYAALRSRACRHGRRHRACAALASRWFPTG
jgi:hypothetical protein